MRDVFIVLGYADMQWKNEIVAFLSQYGINAKILQQYPNKGMTIIEKLENVVQNIDYAIFLYSPLDKFPTKKGTVLFRARQNVVLETGFFTAALSRQKVAYMLKENKSKPIDEPSDIQGILKIKYKKKSNDWKIQLLTELNSIFHLNLNKAIVGLTFAKEITILQSQFGTGLFSRNDVLKVLKKYSVYRVTNMLRDLEQSKILSKQKVGNNNLYHF